MSFYQQNYKIVGSDMDLTYHLSPNAVLLYFQDCFANYLSSKMLASFDIVKDNLFWIISQFSLSFVGKRPVWSDTITVEIWVKEVSSIRIYVNYRIKDSEGNLSAEGESIWAIINTVTKRPFVAVDLLAERGVEINHTSIKSVAFPSQGEKVLYKEVPHLVNLTDLDFNGHMCNRSYLTVAISTAPVEFVCSYRPKHILIKFMREAFLGDELNCQVYKISDTSAFYHSIKNRQGKEICSIASEWTPNTDEQRDIALCIKR